MSFKLTFRILWILNRNTPHLKTVQEVGLVPKLHWGSCHDYSQNKDGMYPNVFFMAMGLSHSKGFWSSFFARHHPEHSIYAMEAHYPARADWHWPLPGIDLMIGSVSPCHGKPLAFRFNVRRTKNAGFLWGDSVT